MSTIRPFGRADRDQLTALVNAHIAAVVPGVSISVNALLSRLEREPAEAIVDPWVVERRTLVAVERGAVVAGAHVLRALRLRRARRLAAHPRAVRRCGLRTVPHGGRARRERRRSARRRAAG